MRFKKTVLLLLMIVKLYSWEDSDMDGVSNIDDFCPNTKFEYLVDNIGCPIDGNIGKISLIMGSNINIDNSITYIDYDLFINYSYKLWAISIYSSKDTTDDNTLLMGDLYLSLHYNIISEEINTKLSLGVKFAIGEDDVSTGENDYFTSISIKYPLSSNLTLISKLDYTFTGDSRDTNYKNPLGYSVGMGYNIDDDWYSEFYYQNSSSIYDDSENYRSISISTSYNFSDTIWSTFSYSKGLDDISYQDIFSIKLGVNFE